MTAQTVHQLNGLEPDNLLAFLALMGAMRALQAANLDWSVRVHWDTDNPPVHPILSVTKPVTQEALADAIVTGCDALAADHDFGGQRKLNWSQREARTLLSMSIPSDGMTRSRSDMLAALVSDAAVREGTVLPTPLCMQFGQGHQEFLDRFGSIPRQRTAPPRGTGTRIVAPTARETIELALFHPWNRVDESASFRWDPEEDRRYALRYMNPSVDGVRTVHGANRLAALGLPVFTVTPRSAGGRVRLQMIGSRLNQRRELEVSWPIWTRAASLEGLRALLTSPLLTEPEVDSARLACLSVCEVRRATRISVGKFLNVTRAEVVPFKSARESRSDWYAA